MVTESQPASSVVPEADQDRSTSVRAALRSPRRIKTELLAGLVVALALIPEAISFSVIAGVDPKVGLFASVTMAITIAIAGGRPAMISAATAAVALVIAPVMAEHGLDHLIATVLLGGVIQVLLSAAGVARLLRFIPRSVMIGFVNALAILVLLAQLPHLISVPWPVYPLVAAGLVIVFALPKVFTAVPAPLVAIVVLTAVVALFGWQVPDVADEGELPTTLPTWMIPDVPWTWQTLTIIGPYALAMALVGLLESLLTAKLVDDITDTHSNKTREGIGQGVANLITGLFGGMGGCAVVGQTMMNVKAAGARTRLSTFAAGAFLLVLLLGLGELVGAIPMAALVAVMIMVAAATFDWHSVAPRTLRVMPRSETAVMIVTVVATVATGNLAIGVIGGVLVAAVLFARRVAHLTGVERVEADPEAGTDTVTYRVRGQLFFASANDLVYRFDYRGDPPEVRIDLSAAEVWDASSVATLDVIVRKYAARGTRAEITGLGGASRARLDRLTGRLGED